MPYSDIEKKRAKNREYQKEYRKKNKEKLSAKYKEYYQNNKIEIIEKREKYAIENADHVKQWQAEWRRKNKEKISKYYMDNRDEILKRQSRWRDRNRVKLQQRRRIYKEKNRERIALMDRNRYLRIKHTPEYKHRKKLSNIRFEAKNPFYKRMYRLSRTERCVSDWGAYDQSISVEDAMIEAIDLKRSR